MVLFVQSGESIIRDLVYRIEGYSDNPDYIINSISICGNGNIEIVCREKPEAETQAEPQGAKDESDK